MLTHSDIKEKFYEENNMKRTKTHKSEPIRPDDITKEKQKSLPDEVIDAFNELIAMNWDGSSATVMQKEVVASIAHKLNINSNDIIYKNHRKSGWEVEYDKPGYCESYDAHFKFRKSC